MLLIVNVANNFLSINHSLYLYENSVKAFVSLSFVIFLAGCSSTSTSAPNQEAFNSYHDACYSYSYGYNGVKKNTKKALDLCKKAVAENGGNNSKTLLAELYYLDGNVKGNLLKAIVLYTEAAKAGHQHAQLMLYYIYNIEFSNFSTEKEKQLGLTYLHISANAGYQKAINALDKYNQSLKGD